MRIININIGDKVIHIDGRKGEIISICTCERCKLRGFFEPKVKWGSDDYEYITDSDEREGFKNFYKIGENIFENHLKEGSNMLITEFNQLREFTIEQLESEIEKRKSQYNFEEAVEIINEKISEINKCGQKIFSESEDYTLRNLYIEDNKIYFLDGME